MSRRDRYAADTAVPIERSRAEIERLLERFGADQFGFAGSAAFAQVMFRAKGRTIRFDLPLSVTDDPRVKAQRDRAAWRALVLSIKAKVVAVESQIVTFDVEFMPQTVMPDGRTVAQHALPAIEDSYKNRKSQSLLPHFED